MMLGLKIVSGSSTISTHVDPFILIGRPLEMLSLRLFPPKDLLLQANLASKSPNAGGELHTAPRVVGLPRPARAWVSPSTAKLLIAVSRIAPTSHVRIYTFEHDVQSTTVTYTGESDRKSVV